MLFLLFLPEAYEVILQPKQYGPQKNNEYTANQGLKRDKILALLLFSLCRRLN